MISFFFHFIFPFLFRPTNFKERLKPKEIAISIKVFYSRFFISDKIWTFLQLWPFGCRCPVRSERAPHSATLFLKSNTVAIYSDALFLARSPANTHSVIVRTAVQPLNFRHRYSKRRTQRPNFAPIAPLRIRNSCRVFNSFEMKGEMRKRALAREKTWVNGRCVTHFAIMS